MNFKNIINSAGRVAKKAGYKIKRHAPTILIFVGGGLSIGGVAFAIKETTKLEPVMDDIHADLDKLKTYREQIEAEGSIKYDDGNGNIEEYTKVDYTKDLIKVYVRAGLKLGKLYAPAMIFEAASLSCFGVSHNMMLGRESRALQATAAVTAAFESYRARIREDHGEEYDYDVAHDIHRGTVEEPVIKKNGEIKTDKNGEVVTKPVEKVIGPILCSPNAFIFDETSTGMFTPNAWQLNEMFVKETFDVLYYRLLNDGFIFKNDILKAFGKPYNKDERDIGLIYDPHDKTGAKSMSSKTVGNPMVPRILTLRSDNLTDEQSKYFMEHRDHIIIDFETDGDIIPYIDDVMYPAYPRED